MTTIGESLLQDWQGVRVAVTQEALAEELCTTQQTVQKMLAGGTVKHLQLIRYFAEHGEVAGISRALAGTGFEVRRVDSRRGTSLLQNAVNATQKTATLAAQIGLALEDGNLSPEEIKLLTAQVREAQDALDAAKSQIVAESVQ